jgi:hypothetical protein
MLDVELIDDSRVVVYVLTGQHCQSINHFVETSILKVFATTKILSLLHNLVHLYWIASLNQRQINHSSFNIVPFRHRSINQSRPSTNG